MKASGRTRNSIVRRCLRIAVMFTVLFAFAPIAAACPTCAVGAGIETLAYIVAFLGIPYVIVVGTLFWVRRLLKSEQESIAEVS